MVAARSHASGAATEFLEAGLEAPELVASGSVSNGVDIRGLERSLFETHVAAPPTADVRVLPAPAAPLVAVENAPAAPEVAVEKAPAAPEVAVEKAPAAPEVAVWKTPPPKEVTVEAAPPAPEVTNLSRRLGGESVIESPLGGQRETPRPRCNALVSGHGSAGDLGKDATTTASDDTADSSSNFSSSTFTVV